MVASIDPPRRDKIDYFDIAKFNDETNYAVNARRGDDEFIDSALSELTRNQHQRLLFDYWCSKKNGDELPRWSSFDLMDLYEIAPFLIVKDVREGGADFVNRYWGTGMTQISGTDETGKRFEEYCGEEDVAVIRPLYALPVKARQAVMFSGRILVAVHNVVADYDALIVPCTDESGAIMQLVTAIQCDDVLGDRQ